MHARLRGFTHALLVLACCVSVVLAASPAEAKWKRICTLEFNGGAIVDFCPVSNDTALVLAAMPEGFSIYSLDFVSGGIRKLVSQTYLTGLVPDSSDVEDLRMDFDAASGLLLLSPREGKTAPVLLNVKSAPYLTRYILGLPEGYRVGASAFGHRKLYLAPSLEFAAGGAPGLLVFDPSSEKLTVTSPIRKLALVEELFSAEGMENLLLLGTFTPSTTGKGSSLAWMASDGNITLIPGSEAAILAAYSPGHIAWVCYERERAVPSDELAANYRLMVMPSAGGNGETRSLALNNRPTWFAVAERGATVLLVSSNEDGASDLWSVNISSRARERVRAGVLYAKMSPDGEACFMLPYESNHLELFAAE